MAAPVYMALLHHPMRNRRGEEVTTAVTNLDIHDLARSARTFGMKRYFLLTPIEMQQQLVGRIIDHWQAPETREYHPDRVEALKLVKLVGKFDEIVSIIRDECGEEPEVVLTDARPHPNSVSYSDYRKELADPQRSRPVLLAFGTGWGISDTFFPAVHRILDPVYGPEGAANEGGSGYNHLSVRAAVAIILDRLFGK